MFTTCVVYIIQSGPEKATTTASLWVREGFPEKIMFELYLCKRLGLCWVQEEESRAFKAQEETPKSRCSDNSLGRGMMTGVIRILFITTFDSCVIWDASTMNHRQGVLQTLGVYFSRFGDWKSEIRVLTWLGCCEISCLVFSQQKENQKELLEFPL